MGYVREAYLQDESYIYKMICDLEEDILDVARFHDRYISNLNHHDIIYLVYMEHELPVGFLSCHIQNLLHHNERVGEIQEFYLYEQFRGKGIGKQMLKDIRNVLEKKDCFQIEVTCRKTRKHSIRFYENNGFTNSHNKLVIK